MFHTVLFGKDECRATGRWDLMICQSRDRAIEYACGVMRLGLIAYAIQAGGNTIMDEAQILAACGSPQSK
jgi:hypothetical protein